ncbi:hypothetical protein HUC17_20775 [Escherichia coli]|nr:hypothetical protein [Escherichia coli]
MNWATCITLPDAALFPDPFIIEYGDRLAMLLEGIDWRQPKRLLTSLTML